VAFEVTTYMRYRKRGEKLPLTDRLPGAKAIMDRLPLAKPQKPKNYKQKILASML